MNNQGNMGAQKENGKSPETKFKAMKGCDLNDREFKIEVMKMLNEIQENWKRQFNEFRENMNKQKKHFTKDV